MMSLRDLEQAGFGPASMVERMIMRIDDSVTCLDIFLTCPRLRELYLTAIEYDRCAKLQDRWNAIAQDTLDLTCSFG